MSTYFDISCLDCKITMHDHGGFNHREPALQSILDNRKAFEAVSEAAGPFDIDVRLGHDYIDLGWLVEHKDHRLAVKCEYEDFRELEERVKAGNSWDKQP